MREESFVFGSDPVLSAKWAEPDDFRAVVVFAHPHPAYGGSMSNNVVRLGCHHLNQHGFATLRYDFRGAGQSEGRYDNGRGERQDAINAVAEAIWRLDGESKPLVLIGYSFGSWVTWSILEEVSPPAAVVLVSPPLGQPDYDFSPYAGRIAPSAAFIGDQDHICPQSVFRKEAVRMDAQIHTETFEGVDHFWLGHETQLADRIAAFLDSCL